MIKRHFCSAVFGLLTSFLPVSVSFAFETFVIKDIRVDGLQRISVSKIYRKLPLDIGDKATPEQVATAIRALYKTGNFQDVRIEQEDQTLIVKVSERPSISRIDIKGNKFIKTEDLEEGLKQEGLAKGSVFQRATLAHVKNGLERQYVAQGRYGAKVTPEVVAQPRNRVALNIHIEEGEVALIKHINIIGNHLVKDEVLLELFQLKKTHLTSFFKGDNKYARERLAGDLETLRSYYMDRGYINFNIESTQVSIDPSKEHIYISISLNEGEKFTIDTVDITGELPFPETEVKNLIKVKSGAIFSRKQITLTEDLIRKKLGNVGYTFAKVKGIPQLNQDKNTVKVSFLVEPGKRVYVRRINFNGNNKTADHVMRREMRQMEGTWASTEKIELSKLRLQRLGFFKGVKVRNPKVVGTDDQVDVNFTVEEQPSGSIGASIGYQGGTGLVFGANVSQRNFLGTGNQVEFSLQRTDLRNSYSFRFLDPYYTIDGVSRGYNFYFSETDFSESDLSSYRTDAYGANLSFGYPINENERLSFSLGLDTTTIFAQNDAAQLARDFINYQPSPPAPDLQSDSFETFLLTSSWRRSTLNRGLLPTRGSLNRLSLELSIPGSELEYYKLVYQAERYLPLSNIWTLRLRTELGFGDGYAETDSLPFYKHFFSGGVGSVRGFETRSLGPRDNTTSPDPFGGNFLTESSMEFIFPTPFVKDKRTVRTAFFIDAGQVFDTNRDNEPTPDDEGSLPIEIDQLRYSAGIGLVWITAIGPLTFTFAKAFNEGDDDETQVFDFTLGQTF